MIIGHPRDFGSTMLSNMAGYKTVVLIQKVIIISNNK